MYKWIGKNIPYRWITLYSHNPYRLVKVWSVPLILAPSFLGRIFFFLVGIDWLNLPISNHIFGF